MSISEIGDGGSGESDNDSDVGGGTNITGLRDLPVLPLDGVVPDRRVSESSGVSAINLAQLNADAKDYLAEEEREQRNAGRLLGVPTDKPGHRRRASSIEPSTSTGHGNAAGPTVHRKRKSQGYFKDLLPVNSAR